jgi:6-pyruvoyltetrahydropterin/6-carboxytetrahydropterin synthase
VKLIVKEAFDAAHQLRDYEGPCATMHGHTWVVDVVLVPAVGSVTPGLSIDFKLAREMVRAELPDHRTLNAVYAFNPTAENLAVEFGERLTRRFSGMATVESVTVWESPKAAAVASHGIDYEKDEGGAP